jgi:hypothetical protein
MAIVRAVQFAKTLRAVPVVGVTSPAWLEQGFRHSGSSFDTGRSRAPPLRTAGLAASKAQDLVGAQARVGTLTEDLKD